MDSCLAVEREGEKVAKRMRVASSETNELLENVLDELKVLKDELMQRKSLCPGWVWNGCPKRQVVSTTG